MKYKNVICIYPYKQELKSYGFFPPLGLEYVASAIEDIVESVKIIDMRYEKKPLGPMTMGEIAERVRMPLSTATRVVDRLVVRELVQRERPEDNRRVVRVALAPAGHATYQAALRSRIAGAQRMLQRLTKEEQHELVRLVRKIADSIAEESTA